MSTELTFGNIFIEHAWGDDLDQLWGHSPSCHIQKFADGTIRSHSAAVLESACNELDELIKISELIEESRVMENRNFTSSRFTLLKSSRVDDIKCIPAYVVGIHTLELNPPLILTLLLFEQIVS